jgi:Ca2+-binding EF-hand superfamily protein
MKKIMMLTAAVFALQALPAFAESGPKGAKHDKDGRFLEKVDANKDGKISQDEYLNVHKERFTQMDANKDGFVTKEEGKAHHDAKKAEWTKKREEMKAKKAAEKPAEAPKAE